MDLNRFDDLARVFSGSGTRRRVLGLLTTLPVVGVVLGVLAREETEAAGRRKRRKTRNTRRSGDRKKNRTGQIRRTCAKAGQTPQKGRRKGCCQGLRMDASGHCAAMSAGCTGLKPTETSLTQGLQEALDQLPPGATLTLCAGTWKLAKTVLIGKDLTLIGAGADASTLDGDDKVRVLEIAAGAIVRLQNLTVTKGFSFQKEGGGIVNAGTLTLLEVSVKVNTAGDFGGGIANTGTLTLQTGTRVTGNTADGYGGGVHNSGTVTLEAGSSVTDNTSTRGDGAGILNAGTLTLQTSSSVADNSAILGNGGGIINSGTVTLETGSSVTGNSASTGTGGGIFNLGGGTVTVQTDSRVTGNSAAAVDENAGKYGGGGIHNNAFFNPGSTVTLEGGAIVCGNTPKNCSVSGGGTISGTCPDGTCPN